ncbi:unnamed protein product [Discosporangium mesarthrocarpum]
MNELLRQGGDGSGGRGGSEGSGGNSAEEGWEDGELLGRTQETIDGEVTTISVFFISEAVTMARAGDHGVAPFDAMVEGRREGTAAGGEGRMGSSSVNPGMLGLVGKMKSSGGRSSPAAHDPEKGQEENGLAPAVTGSKPSKLRLIIHPSESGAPTPGVATRLKGLLS